MKRTALPQYSILKTKKDFKFIDGYKAVFTDEKNEIDIQKIAKLFFSASPKWMDKLLMFRNKIVGLFGLKTGGKLSREEQLKNFKCELNEQVGLFKVFYKSDNEVLLGENDKHLDFRVSLFLENSSENANEKELTISTSVKLNNQFGRWYFIPVKPFHQFIVPAMLKGIIREINTLKGDNI